MAALTPTLKADRLQMAKNLCDLALSFGFIAFYEDAPLGRAGEFWVRIEARDARVTIDIDADAAKYGYLTPWHMATDSEATYAPSFGRAVGAQVNQFHRRKCMGHAESWPELIDAITEALYCIAGGQAFGVAKKYCQYRGERGN